MLKKWIVGGLVLLLSGGGYYYYTQRTTPTTTTGRSQFAIVQTGSIRTVVKATGKIYPIQESIVTFVKQGTITKIYKKVGDEVTKGELIGEIDATTAYLDIKNNEISVSNAQNNYNDLVNGGIEQSKLKAANTLSDSRAQLDLLEKQYTNLLAERDNAIKNAETNITSLETNLEIAQGEYEYAEKNISTDTTSNNLERDISNAYSSVEQIYQVLPDYIKQLKDAALIDDKSNPRYGDLGAKDSGIKTSVESLYTSAVSQKTDFENTLSTLRTNPNSVTALLASLEKAKIIFNTLNNLSTMVVAEYRASNESIYIPETLITSTVTDMQSLSTTLANKLSGVNSTIVTLKGYGDDEIQALADKNTLRSKQATVTTAQNNLEKAKQDLATTKTSYEAKILSAQQSLLSQKQTINLNEISDKSAINGAKTDLVSASNSVQSAKISLEKAKIGLKDYQILAPFDGVITDIPWIIGDTTTSNEGVSIQNKNAYEINVSLDQADVVKVKPGMSVNITLDAYADATWTGTVSSVSSTPTESSSVVSYTAKILLSNVDKEIFSQMSATVEIITTERNDILMIPSNTTTSEKGKTYVEIIDGMGPNASSKKVEVELGVTDNGNVEVLSGLTLGQRIKLPTSGISTVRGTGSGSSSSSSSSRTSNGSFGGGGMGMPPGF